MENKSLKSPTSQSEISKFCFDDLYLGQSAELRIEISKEDILQFADFTGDYHPLHTLSSYAIESGFDDIMAHGLLLSSYTSRLIGMQLPGENALVVSQSFQYLQPVFPDSQLIIKGTVKKIIQDFRQIQVLVDIVKEEDRIVAKGKFTVKLRK